LFVREADAPVVVPRRVRRASAGTDRRPKLVHQKQVREEGTVGFYLKRINVRRKKQWDR